MLVPDATNPFSQWKYIHFIGKINLNLEHPRLYRYEYYSRFEEMYKGSRIVFPSPLSWPDLFEQRFLSDSFLKYCFGECKENKTLRNRIFALCCTGDGSENADAQWNLRKTKEHDFCVRYSFNLWKFLNQLNSLSNGDVEFYISSISYDYSQEELIHNQHIRSLGKPSGKDHIPYLIRIMSYKRKAFKFENEIRIWSVVKEETSLLEKDKKILSLENFDWNNLGLRLHVAPYKSDISFNEFDNDLKDYNQTKRNKENLIQQGRIDKVISELGLPRNDVKASRLYDVALWKHSKALDEK